MTKKFLLYCFLFCCVAGKSFSQAAPLQVIIQNQYEGAVKEAAITVVGRGEKYVTDEKGKLTLNASAADMIRIDHEGYDTAAVPLSTISKYNILKVKKNFTWKDLLTPMFYIINGGLWLILFIIFAETGLFAGFFLPGDSLLFVAGIYNQELIGTVFHIENEYLQLMVLWLLISAAGILGNSVGYWFGRKVGPAMYSWKDNLLFKQKYLQEAHEFYEKHGGGAIIIARFLPIVRTFAPIVAGIVEMDKKKFSFYNIVGCVAWVFSMLVAGHFLQKWILSQFDFNLKEHLEVIVVGIVLVTTAPVFIKLVFGKKKKS
ncbi:MAG: VTT domain-containing protein [Chitinophagaceae bacterium]|nr:VTT domain-containing protein [Chitinophagaceae bacterium]